MREFTGKEHMANYNLTTRQKEVLCRFVKAVKSGAQEPLIVICTFQDCDVIGVGTFDHSLPGDLEILCEADLLGLRYNSSGDKVYTVKQSGYDAVENNFVAPELVPSAQINIGAIIHEMNNGNVQAVGFSSHSELQQTVNDPAILKEKIDDLANELLDAIKTELPAEQLIAYIKSLEELKQQLVAEKSSPPILERLFRALSFTGDVEGSISLMTRVWPYVYPLLIIASERLKAG
jgi:hypothetical protein